MQKHKENVFLEKFSLLNSQDNSEDIKWSSSSSSDNENTSHKDHLCSSSKTLSRKRKRKKKTLKNISNLDVTITDAFTDSKRLNYREKSPILVMKRVGVNTPTSPILTSSRFPANKRSSPILSMSMKCLQQKSPILVSKSSSPKYSSKVKKKLAYHEQNTLRQDNGQYNTGGIIDSNFKTPDIDKNHVSKVDRSNISPRNETESRNHSPEVYNSGNKSDLPSSIKSEESGSLINAKVQLMNEVKSYFDSHFSSENTSQNISDTPTPEECLRNETIDILSCRTQSASILNVQNLSKPASSCTSNSDTSTFFEKYKKVKYKKGGLAYRLNMLLKKQSAHISLWQHERFLAGTSNFVIPKEENVVFFIKKVNFKYGCYLIGAVDVKNDKYIIIMNTLYVNNNVMAESVLKLYEPYRILENEDKDYKIIINVCKFECFDLNNR